MDDDKDQKKEDDTKDYDYVSTKTLPTVMKKFYNPYFNNMYNFTNRYDTKIDLSKFIKFEKDMDVPNELENSYWYLMYLPYKNFILNI